MKRSYIIFLFVIFTIFSFEIIYFSRVIKKGTSISAKDVNNTAVKNYEKEENKTKIASSSTVKVSPSANLDMTQYYKECGHVVNEVHKIPNAIVNMSEDEVKKYYSGWNIDYFSKDYIKMTKENDGICPEHYLLKDMDGFISIFNEKENGEELLYKATDIITKYLSEEDRLNLEKGVYVVGKDALETILQDYE